MSEHPGPQRDTPPHLAQPSPENRSSTLETTPYVLAVPTRGSEASATDRGVSSPTPVGPNAGTELSAMGPSTAPITETGGSDEHRSSPLDSVNSAPEFTIRFDSLAGRIPDDQLGRLRAFVSHHAIGIQRLRIAEANLSNLNGQLNEVKEHTTSLTRRIDRAMADNARFLLESDAQLSELGRLFDVPRPTIASQSGILPGPPLDAVQRLEHTTPSVSDDGLYAPAQAEAEDSASRAHHGIATGPRSTIGSLARVALSSSSQASLPARQQHETDEQYDARYEANIRNVARTEESWSRAYPESNHLRATTTSAAASRHNALPRDVRFQRTGTSGESTTRRPYGNIPQPATMMRDSGESASRPPNPYAGISVPPIGISAYRVTQGPVTNGLWNHDHYHYVVLLGKITQLIEHKVGTHIDVPPGLKQPKLSEPPKYSGSHSHDDFVDWLSTFLNWLRGHYICGPATDTIRVNYLGLYVDSVASDWFHTEIDNPARRYDSPLSFSDCICLMHKRFVRTATANDAAIKYNAVRYLASEGVEGLFYKLDAAAERMIERPNDYEFRRRLFNLLPIWLHDKLKDRNIIPEYASLEDLRENARQLEENSLRRYEGVGDTPNLSTARATARTPKTSRMDEARARTSPAPVAARQVPTAAPPRPSGRAPQTGQTSRPPRDTSTMLCYSCGKMGHIASEPKCENYDASKARLHAQREVDENDDGDAPNSPNGHNGDGLETFEEEADDAGQNWGGSQYESNYASGEDPEDAPEGDARMASMYVRVAAMRAYQGSRTDDAIDLERVADVELLEDHASLEDISSENQNTVLDDEMPALESCSDSDDEMDNHPSTSNGQNSPSSPSGDTGIVSWASQLSTILRAANGNRTVMDMSNGFRTIPLRRLPRYIDDPYWPTQSSDLPRLVVSDNGIDNYREHLPNPDTIRIVNHTVWLDVQEHILEFDEADGLENYNRLLSSIVPCHICDGVCRPTVYQVLARARTGSNPPAHMNLYACNLPRRLASPSPGRWILDDLDDRYADPHGDYDEECMYAMRVTFSSNIRRPTAGGELTRPRHNPETITAVVMINGHKALTLFDSGSTTDSITPEFGFVSRTKQFKLEDQITLQLGCVGSRSKISYGARAPVAVFGISEDMYFDIVNIDRYDAILGTPFLRRHGVCIDFKNGGIIVGGQFHKTFSVSEEIAYIAKRGEGREQKKIRSSPRDTAPIRPRIVGSAERQD
ncbi:hypothetical protein HWV62_30501 [Athelia sp. TMB]|nr:hypothetical protein HWV62_30501 [Athelia sp. TMB]